MIRFDNWTIQADGDILARQFDNLTRTLTVAGDIPSGWEWAMLVQVGEAMDIILLDAAEGALSAVLTAQQLSVAGYYNLQLRGTQGEKVKHTNTVNVYIPASLSGDEQWPTIPSEFTELERRVNETAKKAESYMDRAPSIGENGNWWEWDGEAYVDTGKPSRGEQGVQGEKGETGATGPQGERGLQGPQGIQGETGSQGEQGPKGETGERGERGEQGPQGIQGERGEQGVKGDTGPQGEQGIQGPRGEQGPKGDPGELTVRQGNTLYANALKGTASGEVVRLDDVSPLKHTVNVTVSGVDDPAAVTVKAQGKNLVNPSAYARGATRTTLSGDVFTTEFTNGAKHLNTGYTYTPAKHPSGTYTVTFVPVSAGAQACLFVYAADDNAQIANLYGVGANGKYSLTFTANEEFYVSVAGDNDARGTHSYKLQLEVGATATAYEPYIEPVSYPVSADGSCSVASIHPAMTLTTDTEGAVVDCEYNRDINKVIEQLTQAIISMGGNI